MFLLKKNISSLCAFFLIQAHEIFFPKKNPINTRAFLLNQLFFLLPLLLMLIILSFYCGSESPASFFAESREEKGIIYKCIKMISQGNILGYTLYGIYFIFAFMKRDPLGKYFFIYYILMQGFFGAIAEVLKISVGRPRPYTGESQCLFFNFSRDYHSFPSGHTTEIYGAFGPFAQKSFSLFIVFLWGLIPATIAFSRIYLAMHHRSDVLAGAILGSFTTYCIVYLTLIKRNKLKQQGRKRFFSVESS